MLAHAKSKLEPYQENKGQAPPDPSFVLQFPDEIDDGATLYGVQKSFDGPFQFDVFFESASGSHDLSCTCKNRPLMNAPLICLPLQLPCLTK